MGDRVAITDGDILGAITSTVDASYPPKPSAPCVPAIDEKTMGGLIHPMQILTKACSATLKSIHP